MASRPHLGPVTSLNAQTSFVIRGVKPQPFRDLYRHLLGWPWPLFLLCCVAFYICAIAIFALWYWLDPITLAGSDGSFFDCFWFSLQSFATIGYGSLAPQSLWSNLGVLFESFIGLGSVATVGALIYAKFSRTNARVAFSNSLVIHRRNQEPVLLFRLANERKGGIIDASLKLTALIEEKSFEGDVMRRFRDIQLERGRVPVLSMTWLAIHTLNESSPLWSWYQGKDLKSLRFLFASFMGTDEASMQTIHARHVYQLSDIKKNHRFIDIVSEIEGRMHIDHSKLHDIQTIAPEHKSFISNT